MASQPGLSASVVDTRPGNEEPAAAFLEIKRAGATLVEPRALRGNRELVGRNPELGIVLDHESVSRLHGEFVRDPYGQWWIHDLGSTNGTYVNGSKVTQRLLNAGDVVHIGDFSLRFRVSGAALTRDVPGMTEPPPSTRDRHTTQRFQVVRHTKVDATHLASTLEFGRELTEIESQGARLAALCRFTVSDRFPGLATWVVQLDNSGQAAMRAGPIMRRSTDSDAVSARNLEQLALTHKAALVRSPGALALTWDQLKPVKGGKRTAVACALDPHAEGLSALYVEFDTSAFSEEWVHMVKMLADAYHQANLMWEVRGHVRVGAKVDHELEMARQIQDRLVPKAPAIQGLELAIGYEPCQWVGGDYVDAVRMADGRLLLAVADVCGKGLQAALVTSSLHTLVHVAVDEKISLCRLVAKMNSYLCEYLPVHSFVTLVCVAIDAKTGLMECVNAGHPPAIVVEDGGKVTLLQSNCNVALGMVETEFVSECSILCERDVLFLYTDGLTEAEDPQRHPLGTDGLRLELTRIVTSLPDADVETLRRRLTQAISMHRGTLMAKDDTTFLIARLAKTSTPSGLYQIATSPH